MPLPEEAPRSRFALQGRSWQADPRIDAVRRDLADIRLAGLIFAPHYARAQQGSARHAAPIRAGRADNAPVLSEVLAGETFEILELASDYAWGVSTVDGVVGYVTAEALGEPIDSDHIVVVPVAEVRGEADPHAPVIARLPMGSRIAASGDGALRAISGGYVLAEACRPIDEPANDFVAIAEGLIGVPTVPGGRSGAGVDSTGLVFLSLAMAGIQAPRFCGLQRSDLGRDVAQGEALRRGDLVYFDDHVAIMVDGETAIHADAEAVKQAPLQQIVAQGGYGEILARRRPA